MAGEFGTGDERRTLVFPLARPALAIQGGGLFPVRRVYCAGRNYREHAIEMGSDPSTEPPFFFQKPADALQQADGPGECENPYPPLTRDYQPEIELVVALGSGGTNITAAAAPSHVYGFAVGLDMTRRDLQTIMKNGGKPWEIAKSFDHSAPIGLLVPKGTAGAMTAGAITLSVNGGLRQKDDLASMILGVAGVIAELSKGGALSAGDLIFTGTPAGVAPVRRGDELLGRIAGLPDLRVRIV